MFEEFRSWLEITIPNSARHYSSGYNTINRISNSNGFRPLEEWNLEEWDTLFQAITSNAEFINLNTTGNNILSSTLSQFKRFLEERQIENTTTAMQIPPEKPFDELKWRWASTTPSEKLNRKDVLLGVLQILYNHNGQRHATQEFKDDLRQLEDSLPDLSVSLSRREREVERNIIENSGQYWKALGFMNELRHGIIDVSDFGKRIIENNMSDEDILRWEIENFKIPNELIENTQISALYRSHNIEIYPLKLIFRVLSGLKRHYQSPIQWYLTVKELKSIIIPLSVNANIPIRAYIEHIGHFRNDSSLYSTWPNYAPGANDERMIREYLLFLNNFNGLGLITLNTREERFYLNELSMRIIEDYPSEVNLEEEIAPNPIKAKNIIYFGSPGTGKSTTMDSDTATMIVEKTTFHPEYDYHSFVGGYKPTMVGEEIKYHFVPQIFTDIYVDAWQSLSNGDSSHYCLLIEEINRGNCAEIFGDLFQLLDRKDDGSSQYPISVSKELRDYLVTQLGSEHQGIRGGKIKLPPNLSIYATMNTSDQSLFPMDSAFKRRWEWQYIPIDYNCTNSNFVIELTNGKKYKWLDFLKKVNEIIFEITLSQDKQLGNWFVKASSEDRVINENTFKNKVLFYLWNDVFKDEDKSIFNLEDRNISYGDLFTANSSEIIEKILTENLNLSELIDTPESIEE